jgi:hypothetical protein
MSFRVLVACEESQVVTLALRKNGIIAFSCDILPTSGPCPDWHLEMDVHLALQMKWDAVIAFPPCTDLCSSGARWFKEKKKDGRQQASIEFFMMFTRLKCPWAIENPVGIMSSIYRKPDQIIHPWEYGHGETKKTCLWLNYFPILIPTNIVPGRVPRIHRMAPSSDRSKLRSKTYQGVADAIGIQWGRYLHFRMGVYG